MRILESKFYQPKQHFVADRKQRFKVVVDDSKGKPNPYTHALDNSLNRIRFHESDIVIGQEKLDKLVKCTDFTYLEFSKSSNQFYEAEMCYFYPEYELFITLTQDLSDDYDVQLFEQGLYKVDTIFYDSMRDNVKAEVDRFFEEYLQKYMLGEKISILVKESDYFELKTQKINPLPVLLDTMYNDDFLPIHEHIQDSLQNLTKGVVLLHGLAGTGKTNYIKWLITQIPDKKFIFIPTTIIHQLTDPAFLTILLQNKNSVLVLEDCENYIAERSFDNKNTDVVASILNLADGILSDVVECQIVCTFNASIDHIDTALLRKGRLIAEYRFQALTVDRANAYFESVGNDKRTDTPITLVDAIHDKETAYKAVEEKTPFGFV